MSSRKRAIIAGAIVVVAMIGGVLALVLWPEAPEAEPSPGTPSPETYSLVYETAANVKSITITNSGGTHTINYNAKTNTYSLTGTLSFDLPPQDNKLSLTYSHAITLNAVTAVQLGASEIELSAYGFTNPQATWRVNRTDGTALNFEIGKASPVGTGYYVRAAGSSDVYMMSTSGGKNLMQTEAEYYTIDFLPEGIVLTTEDEPTWDLFSYALLEQPSRTVELRYFTDEEFAERDTSIASYQIMQPHLSDANDTVLEKYFLGPMTGIKPSKVVETYPKDLSKYGLDNPSRLTLKDNEEWTGVLLIGSEDTETGGRFVMIEGVNAVLLDTSADYVFLDVPYYRLRTTLVWLYNISGISQVEFYLGSTRRVLDIQHNEEANTFSGQLDGVELSEDNVKRIFRSALSVNLEGDCSGDPPPQNANPAYKVVLHHKNGTTSTMELVAINDRQYRFFINGEDIGLYTLKTTIKQYLIDPFDIVDGGGTIPR